MNKDALNIFHSITKKRKYGQIGNFQYLKYISLVRNAVNMHNGNFKEIYYTHSNILIYLIYLCNLENVCKERDLLLI